MKSQVLFQAFLVFPSPAFQAWKGRVSLRRMPKRRRSKDWFLAWPEKRVKQQQMVKVLSAKFVEPKEREELDTNP